MIYHFDHFGLSACLFEPPHDKTNTMACAPSEDSDQTGWMSLCCPHEETLGPELPLERTARTPRRYFCCGSLLLLVLAVRIYTLVQLLC